MSENLLRAVEVVSDWLRNLSASVSSLLTRVEHTEKDQGHMQRRLEKLEQYVKNLEGGKVDLALDLYPHINKLEERIRALEKGERE